MYKRQTYKWDRAFYNGKYYCYFGIVPALVFYLPYYLVTGHMLKTKILALLLVVIIEMLMAALVYAMARQYKKRLNLWAVSYTHLDVYKRQGWKSKGSDIRRAF